MSWRARTLLLLLAAVWVGLLGVSGYGVWLTFTAAWWLGLLALVCPPIPCYLGFLGVFGHPEISRRIVEVVRHLG